MRRSGDKEKKMEEPKTQVPTIKDAVTYIVDKDGNEVKEGAAVKEERKE